MKLKKLFIALIMIVASLSLASCSNTDNPDLGKDTEVTYPYMDYLEQKVCANSPANADSSFDAFLSNNFRAIGTTTVDEITKTTKVDFGGAYQYLVFTAKTNIEIVSVTFTVYSEKDVFLAAWVCGKHTPGTPLIDTVKSEGSEVEKISAGTSKTYTFFTYRDDCWNSDTQEYNKVIDFGIYDETFSEWDRKLLIGVSTYANKEEVYGEGKYGGLESGDNFIEQDYGISIYNVSFNCKKLANIYK